jgi:hypothetical protein
MSPALCPTETGALAGATFRNHRLTVPGNSPLIKLSNSKFQVFQQGIAPFHLLHTVGFDFDMYFQLWDIDARLPALRMVHSFSASWFAFGFRQQDSANHLEQHHIFHV